MENNESKIKYWTIGTSAILYLNNVKRWLNEYLINKMIKNSDFAIVLNDCDSGRVTANFSCEINDKNEKTIVYQSKKSHTNDYDRTTLSQFFRVLCYFKILSQIPNGRNDKYELSQELINKFNNKIITKENVSEIISIFLLNSVSEKFIEFNIKLMKNLKNVENIHSLLWKDGKDNDNNMITRSLLYHAGEISEFLDLNEIKKIYNKKTSDDNKSTKSNLDFKKVFSTMICNHINKKDSNKEYISLKNSIQKIIDTIRNFYNLPSEVSKKILGEMKTLAIEYQTYLDDSEYRTKHLRKIGGMESALKNIYDLILKFKDEKINIPIFQRDYVWNSELINNLMDSLYDDYKDHNSSYLNNIIMCGSNEKARWQIIDGQQRIFTLLLILFCLFKITTYYDYNLEHKILELLFSHNENKYKDIYTNLSKTNIYGNFSKIIEGTMEGFEYEIIIKIIENIIDNLINKLIDVENTKEKNNSNVSNFIDHILWNTYVSLTTLRDLTPEKIFENINKNGKALDSLDLLRNYIYAMCINGTYEIDKNNNIEYYIDKYNDIIKHFFDDKNKLNYKKLENFALVLYKREAINNNNGFDKSNKSIHTFYLLKEVLESWAEKNKNGNNKININFILNNFLNCIHKYEYIVNCKKSDLSVYPKIEISALSSQIYGATLGGNTIFVSIIWKLLDAFNAYNWEKETTKNENLSELSKWLFEIERFNIFWKILSFKGQSLSKKFDKICDTFFKDENWKENILNFRKELLNLISELESLSDKERNKKLREELEYYLETNPQALSDPLKFLLLNRINFALNNTPYTNNIGNDSLYILSNAESKNNAFMNWHNNFHYEHCLSKNDKAKVNKSSQTTKDDFDKYIHFLGNGAILESGINESIGNNELLIKINPNKTKETPSYAHTSLNNLILRGKEKIVEKTEVSEQILGEEKKNDKWLLVGFVQLEEEIKEKDNEEKLKIIYKWIKDRTMQLNDLIVKIYSYYENE